MNSISEEITRLSNLYYRAIAATHHKDRDCHWFVTKRWSYGNPPYYIAEHQGYLAKDWRSVKCETAAGAESLLLAFLEEHIADMRQAAEETLAYLADGGEEGFGYDEHEARATLEVLNGE